MKNYRERIIQRAEIAEVELFEEQLEFFNTLINKKVENGVDERDALDYVYFTLKNNFK